MLNRYTKVRIQCPRRPRSKVAGSSPVQHRTIPHTNLIQDSFTSPLETAFAVSMTILSPFGSVKVIQDGCVSC